MRYHPRDQGMCAVSIVTPVAKRWIDEGLRDPDAFWERAARELPWFRTWDRVFEWTFRTLPPALPPHGSGAAGAPALPPHRAGAAGAPAFRWFVGGETNLAYNALDHHVNDGRGGHAALIYLNECGERRVFTYAQLLHQVERI